MSRGIIENWSRPKPVVPLITLSLVTLIFAVMVYIAILPGPARSVFLFIWGLVPANVYEVLHGGWKSLVSREASTLLSALVIHASWLHLLGNLAYLWVFGIPVERRVGHFAFFVIFFIAGGIANWLLVLQIPELATPVIGASGSISAVIGCYLGLFPTRKMGLYIPLGLYMQFARVPSLLVIGSWFILQVLYTVFGPVAGQVAWRVHVVGFVTGLLIAALLRLFSRRVRLQEEVD